MGDDDHKPPPTTEEIRQKMISSFTTEITSSSREVAILILEAHQWDIAAAFVESLESPRSLDSPGGKRRVLITLIRRQQEDFHEPPKPFQGVGRTLAEPDSVPPASSDSLTTEPTPSMDPTAPTTSIKVILADGTPIVSRFTTTHHTIRDVRDFIDAATPGASRDYQLLIMGSSPPTPLTTDLDQTIDQAGISNSVLTLKF
ncbi:hypothetical protein BRARA_D01291 [Brassica rapa]|uniref:UBX domain-containing protein n=1 Tax=Brassica campestris TaxID=3711 RepID=A0A397ZM82_BRACM|nr:hypothetical protein BRARA_D01291 [Brassica rapa]